MSDQFKTPTEEFEEAAIRQALYELALEEMAEYDASETSNDSEDIGPSAEAIRSFNRKLDERDRAKRRSRTWREWYKHGMGIAAALLIAVIVGGTVAIATDGILSRNVVRLTVETTSRYTEFDLLKSHDTVEVPDVWEGSIYPTYIPEGFEPYQITRMVVSYRNAADQQIDFGISGIGTEGMFDTENAEVSTINLNGIDVMLIRKGRWNTIVGLWGDMLFDLHGSIDFDEFMKVAESIALIE